MTNAPITVLVIALAIGAPVIAPTFNLMIKSIIIIKHYNFFILVIIDIIIIINIIIHLIYYSSLLLTSLAVIGLITANVIMPMKATKTYN
jgi:hypothetical protein